MSHYELLDLNSLQVYSSFLVHMADHCAFIKTILFVQVVLIDF